MKKTLLCALAAALLVASTGCEKDLDQSPISSGSVPTFYKSADDFTQAMNAAYSSLRDYPDRQLTMAETRSDNIYGVSTQGIRTWEPINNFSTAIASNEYPAGTWTADYTGIYRCNILLDQLAANGSVLTPALRTRYEGEAKFLRALYYLDLVRYFGKVPLIDHALEPQVVAKINRSPVADVYGLIIADLTTASASLAPSYTGADVGRATSWAAKGLLGLVYLTRSGPTYGIEGPGLDSHEYDKAYALFNDITTNGPYQFATGTNAYANIFSYTNENNKEVLFDVQYISGGVGQGASYPSILVTNNYFNSIGVGTTFGTGDELRPASNNLLSTFAAGDVRKTFSLQQGYTTTTAPILTEPRAAFKKYINGALRGTTRTDWPINFIVMRYTDVLMMKAEAILKGGGGAPADVDAIMSQVRARAGLTGTVTGTTYAQLMEERRREFVGEGLRWHDLVRSGNAVNILNAWIAQDDVSKRMRSPLNANDLLYPVPQAELAASAYLYEQNPGY
ncbi:RagB/SusD family nutrient uptake outer membrane protein [Hymenobacter ruricola]|uniref:RagB/SusD family nutrient uptake outer membrane protein n=1 Tax=Hymenobacter ruricola TaxID=2791023 RepID=A0ABS0I2K4_9BACT|nr:RagB/SusD family nutrient uptake outer membrane protein [Hymenobacter ruricola]MBF9221169.1 RagB/SusD family nutrient uptake outer membrane protein [Hymenobacter ruricola]